MASASTSARRTWKLPEFVAHASAVNCLSMGRKSGGVLVTGGEDKKVNMWAVGKPNCLMSLAGHTSPVESVRFNSTEVMVAAGSITGALKVWDLDTSKIMRTLSGHKASIRSIEFHPHGDFITSGSLDSTIKLWDMRKKGCIFTYKGHSGSINCLRFSPDGRWIASGGEDSLLRLWDLTAGKPIADFKDHTGSVNSVEFHPREFFLASGSSDKTVRFFDLELMKCVSVTDPECTAVRTIYFHPEVDCLYGSIQDSVKVYGWEPARCLDSLSMGCGNVADMAFAESETRLVGASFSRNSVLVSMIDPQLVQPIGGPVFEASSSATVPVMPAIPRRRSFIVDNQRPPNHCATGPQVSSRMKAEPEKEQIVRVGQPIADRNGREPMRTTARDIAPAVTQSYLDFQNLDYDQVFQPSHELPRGHPSYTVLPFNAAANSTVTNHAGSQQASALFTRYPSNPGNSATTPRGRDSSEVSPVRNATNEVTGNILSVDNEQEPNNKPKRVINHKPIVHHRTNGAKPSKAVSDAVAAAKQKVTVSSANDTIFLPTRDSVNNDKKDMSSNNQEGLRRHTMGEQMRGREREVPDVMSNSRHRSVASDPVDTINQSLQSLGMGKSLAAEDFYQERIGLSEIDVLKSLTSNHVTIISVLSGRQRTLQIISTQWIAGNIKGAIDTALGVRDPTVFQHVVSQMTAKENSWTLEFAALLLPPLYDLITSKYDSYVLVGLNAVKMILRSFAGVIHDTVAFVPSIGVDLSHEERYGRCSICYKHLMNIREEIDRRSAIGQSSMNQLGSLAQHYREVLLLLNQLD